MVRTMWTLTPGFFCHQVLHLEYLSNYKLRHFVHKVMSNKCTRWDIIRNPLEYHSSKLFSMFLFSSLWTYDMIKSILILSRVIEQEFNANIEQVLEILRSEVPMSSWKMQLLHKLDGANIVSFTLFKIQDKRFPAGKWASVILLDWPIPRIGRFL